MESSPNIEMGLHGRNKKNYILPPPQDSLAPPNLRGILIIYVPNFFNKGKNVILIAVRIGSVLNIKVILTAR
jgi:hypothetical protein